VRILLKLIPVSLVAAAISWSQSTTASSDGLVHKALAAELAAAQDSFHPMRFRLRKSSPRLITTKEIVETSDGSVARLIAVNDKPLAPNDEDKEQSRLQGLLNDPGKQRHRKQAEDDDTGRALKVLRALPRAFLYRDTGPVTTSTGMMEKFTFTPDPKFSPPDLETQVLTQMAGEIWIDPAHDRVVRLEGRLQNDVDFGWGILGRLYKGGWISIEQADVGEGQWRIARFQLSMSGRVLIKTRVFSTTEEQTQFAPVPKMGYKQAIAILRDAQTSSPAAGR
jgi:hypothetical protein